MKDGGFFGAGNLQEADLGSALCCYCQSGEVILLLLLQPKREGLSGSTSVRAAVSSGHSNAPGANSSQLRARVTPGRGWFCLLLHKEGSIPEGKQSYINSALKHCPHT